MATKHHRENPTVRSQLGKYTNALSQNKVRDSLQALKVVCTFCLQARAVH